MRLLLIILLLVNLGFFAFHRFLNEPADAPAQIASLQISPEKIRTVATEVAPAVSAPVAVAPAPVAPQPAPVNPALQQAKAAVAVSAAAGGAPAAKGDLTVSDIANLKGAAFDAAWNKMFGGNKNSLFRE